VPPELAGKPLIVKTGLWKPGAATRRWGRMVPDRGEYDRRIVVGTVQAPAEGPVEFVPAR